MQLQRFLALTSVAVLGGAISSAAAYDFSDVNNATSVAADEEETSSRVANDESRIYGGSEADVSKYSWTVSLRAKPESHTFCGATLVAPQYLVTAAHCVKNIAIYAAIGAQASNGTQGGERIKIAQSWVHEKYNDQTNDYDIAVMKLEKASTAKTLPLAAADGSMNKVNTMAVVRGWGVTQTKQQAATLLEVNVKIISNEMCDKTYKNRITARMLCAGQGAGKDTCQGDSGGPLVASDSLVGVVSWGGECGVAPGVYVRVTSVLDFINSKIGGKAPAPAASPSKRTTEKAKAARGKSLRKLVSKRDAHQ
jgi:secreted trypsin-like serine protease